MIDAQGEFSSVLIAHLHRSKVTTTHWVREWRAIGLFVLYVVFSALAATFATAFVLIFFWLFPDL